MDDLISRRTVIDMVEGWNLNQHIMNEEDALDDVKALPSAQPQIIHCKDCKHHWTHRCMDSMPTEVCDLNQTFYDQNIDFCSLAERRIDE